jgi:hypothetical protein
MLAASYSGTQISIKTDVANLLFSADLVVLSFGDPLYLVSGRFWHSATFFYERVIFSFLKGED